MADNILKTRLISAYNTLDYWSTATTIPLGGEVCYAVDETTNAILEIKIGDGVHKYSELPSETLYKLGTNATATGTTSSTFDIDLIKGNGTTLVKNVVIPAASTAVAGVVTTAQAKIISAAADTTLTGGTTGSTAAGNAYVVANTKTVTTAGAVSTGTTNLKVNGLGSMAFKASSDYIPVGDRVTSISSPASSSKKVPTDYAVVQYLENSVKPMRYMGTVDMTATPAVNLPTSNIRVGDTYKVAGDGNYGPTGSTTAAKVGDLFIAKTTASWDYIPSADDDPGVVSVGADGTYLSTSGQASAVIINHKEQSNVTTGTYGGATSVAQITVDKAGHATSVKNVAIQTATTAQIGLTKKPSGDETWVSVDADNKISHIGPGSVATSYGLSTSQAPAYNSTFVVPYISVDDKGHITSGGTAAVKIPASDNTDQKVKHTATTAKIYPLGVTGTASSTSTVNKSTAIWFEGADGAPSTVHGDYFTGTAEYTSQLVTTAADRGLDVTDGKVGHTTILAATSVGATAACSSWGGTVNIPKIEIDDYGHSTAVTEYKLTIPSSTVTSAANGLAPKLPNDATKYLNGTGGWTVPDKGTDEQVKQINLTATTTTAWLIGAPNTTNAHTSTVYKNPKAYTVTNGTKSTVVADTFKGTAADSEKLGGQSSSYYAKASDVATSATGDDYITASLANNTITVNHNTQTLTTSSTYGASNAVPQIKVDGAGHITSISTVTVKDTIYSAGDKIVLSGTNSTVINHTTAFSSSGSIAAGTAGTADAWGESVSFTVPEFNYDKWGHLTSANSKSFKVAIPSAPSVPVTAVIGDGVWTTVTSSDNAKKFKVAHIGPSSVANTYGTTSEQTPSFNSSFAIPYLQTDDKGHIAAAGTASVKIPSTVASWDYYTSGITTAVSGEAIQVKFNRTDGTNKYNFTIPAATETVSGISSTVSTDRLRNGVKTLILNGNFTTA